jgi:hypothetical protein
MPLSNWQLELVDRLESSIPAAYDENSEPAAEPTALVGLALSAHGRNTAALRAAQWLAEHRHHGAVSIMPSRSGPCWPTRWAMILWHEIDLAAPEPHFVVEIDRATRWTLGQHSETAQRTPVFGHDSTLDGWTWAEHTHAWIEPTAMAVLALKAVGYSGHSRTREAVRLLIDRQLPQGGCNYGNTIVLGQALLAHLQPTGLALLALAGEPCDDPRIGRSLNYLEREISAGTATASLCYGLLGLAAHGRLSANRHAWLKAAYERNTKQNVSPFKLAMIALAAANSNPMLTA